jgi:putative acetyltransferase
VSFFIRAFQPGDLAGVVRCFTESVRVIAARHYDARQIDTWAPLDPDLLSWRERLSTGCVLLAAARGDVAGFVRAEPAGLIDLIYVHPAHERRGIGTRLLAEACAWATANGAKRFEASVSFAARPLFEVAGFSVEREQIVEYKGVTFTNFRMAKQ